MPRISFESVENPGPVGLLPEGSYVCRIVRVERTQTKRGDEMWRLGLVVHDGEHSGRTIKDNLVFSREAMPRVKLLCESLGILTTGEIELVPDMLKDGICRVHVIVEEYRGREQNKVRFDGYARVDAEYQDEGEV